MANSIRNIVTAYSATPDSLEAVHRFVGKFAMGGLGAFMPLKPNAEPSAAWGACPEYGDFEFLTQESIGSGQFRLAGDQRATIGSDKANWVNYNTFMLADHHKEIIAKNLPGFLGCEKTPAAVLVFHTKWSVPDRWIAEVINSEAARGLILHMWSYDVSARADGHFSDYHFYTSELNTQWIHSGCCAAVVHETSGLTLTGDALHQVVEQGDAEQGDRNEGQ